LRIGASWVSKIIGTRFEGANIVQIGLFFNYWKVFEKLILKIESHFPFGYLKHKLNDQKYG
jgi:hypothetical protein